MTKSWGRPVRLALGIAITLYFLRLATRQMRFEGLVGKLAGIQLSWIGLALVMLCLAYATRIFRWWWMLRFYNPEVALRSCGWPLIAGVAINNVVPFRAGDAIRVFRFRKRLDIPVARLLSSLLIERVLDLTILLSWVSVGLWGLGRDSMSDIYLRIAMAAFAIAIAGWSALLFAGTRIKAIVLKFCQSNRIRTRSWGAELQQQAEQALSALDLIRSPDRTLKLLTMTAIVWLCEGGVFAAVASGLHYRGHPFGPWFALATGSLATLIPSSPGYVGTFDFFTLSGLESYGAAYSLAAAAALIIHSVLWLPLTVAGMAYLLVDHFNNDRNERALRSLEEGETQ